MRRFATIVVILGLVGGLLGMFAFNELSGRAGAAAGQPREDQITISSYVGLFVGQFAGAPNSFSYFNVETRIAFDPGDYPVNSAFRLESVAGGGCMRLVDLASWVPVAGSEVCGGLRSRSDPFQMPEGEHEYGVELGCGGPYCLGTEFKDARIIVEWTEPLPVGGIAVFPDIGLSDSAGHNYLVLAMLAFVAVAAFAAGGWYARKRWSR